MLRILLLTHRYLGIAVGALMVMWCLTGVVMMYVGYPALREFERLKHLAPIEWRGCCRLSEAARAAAKTADKFQVEMLAGRPVLYFDDASHSRPIDLLTGSAVETISAKQATAVARPFASGPKAATPRVLGLIDHDQWTVSGDFNARRPLYRLALGDEARTQVYVSSITGQAVQETTARERFWNWLGAVPHWLYFTELRRNAWLWSQVVTYASLIGCFLAGIGVYLGARQMAAQPAGRWSPYRGFNLWHHVAGLIFGIFTLAWVVSGLLSMNPWGWLEGAGAQAENAKMHAGPGPSIAQIGAALQAVAVAHPNEIVSLKGAPLNGKVYFIVSTSSGERRRLDAGAAAAPLDGADLQFVAKVLDGSGAAAAPQLLTQEDDFYFSHHRDQVTLPVYRMVLTDSTRYYVDSVSGMLLAKLDAHAQAYRWLHQGLHRMDFTASLRGRPQWDALMLLLMSGVTVVCLTGAYLGYRRLIKS